MKNDVCIKAGSYCPICKGVVLADCRHDSIQFSVPMRYQRMEFNAQLQNEVDELTRQRDELEKLCNYNERVMQELLQQRDELAAALEKLARLGNEPHYGNSIGNQVARDALAKVGAGTTARPPTPTGWSDTDWLKHLQEQQHPLAGLHINQGSMDAAADAYEAEYNARHNVGIQRASPASGEAPLE